MNERPAGKRLTMLPEVLPAPVQPSDGGPRQRTLAHMRRLLTGALASTAITTSIAAELPAQQGSPAPAPTPAPAPSPQPPTPQGYAVVDPAPPPALRSPMAATLKTTATWKKDNSGLVLEIVLDKPKDGSFLKIPPPNASAGTIVSTSFTDGKLVIRWRPPSAAGPTIAITVRATGPVGPQSLVLQPLLDAPAKEGGRVTISVKNSI